MKLKSVHIYFNEVQRTKNSDTKGNMVNDEARIDLSNLSLNPNYAIELC
jgi:hypothetical protein